MQQVAIDIYGHCDFMQLSLGHVIVNNMQKVKTN